MNGGSAVLDYRISYQTQSTSVWVIVASGVTNLSYTATTDIIAGHVYTFKIESRNIFGYSTTYSSTVAIRAASVADAPINLVNNPSITAAGTIGLSWSSGVSNGGSPIIDYSIDY